jgi:mitochondrial translocator assembly and maintenance protein 41
MSFSRGASRPLRSWLGELVRGVFPPTRMAFAYGSGVFSQVGGGGGGGGARPMIDMVLAVDDPVVWHAENMERNRSHYSAIAHPLLGGAVRVASLQDTAARVWYNAMVPVPAPWGGGGQLMKYGVISRDALVDDLQNWSSFYIGGRMQKPVAMIDGFGVHGRTVREAAAAAAAAAAAGGGAGRKGGKESGESPPPPTVPPIQPEDDELFRASESNLQHALTAALLLLPETFTEQTLYETIAGLSYAGDFRMSIAENPDKVKNIVRNGGSPVRFRDLYTRSMRTSSASELRGFTTEHMCDGDIDDVGDNKLLAPEYIELHQNVSAKARANLLLSLPLVFRRRMVGHVEDASIEEASVDEKLKQRLFACSDDLAVSQLGAGIVSQALKEIVSQTAVQQTMKGLVSAGVTKSAVYAATKIGKRLRF